MLREKARANGKVRGRGKEKVCEKKRVYFILRNALSRLKVLSDASDKFHGIADKKPSET